MENSLPEIAKQHRPTEKEILNFITSVKDESMRDIADHLFEGAEAYKYIKQLSLAEIREIGFSKEELTAMIDCLNGILLTPAYQCYSEVFIGELEDFQLLEGGLTSSGVDPLKLYEKVKKLTAAQVYVFQEELRNWWCKTYKYPPPTLEEYIRKFQK